MSNLQNHLRWYSKNFFKPGVKRGNSLQENSPFKSDFTEYLFIIVDTKKKAENTARVIKTTFEKNILDLIDSPESINDVPYRIVWISSPLVFGHRDIALMYPGRTSYDPQMYYAYEQRNKNRKKDEPKDLTGLREYIHTRILQFAPAAKKSGLARFLMF